MPNESTPRALSATLTPGRRQTTTRSGSSTPSNPSTDNRKSSSNSPARRRTNATAKARGLTPPYKVKTPQPDVKQQPVRLSSKTSYAAQCSAAAQLKVLPKASSAQRVSNHVTPKRVSNPIVLRVSTSSPSTSTVAAKNGTPTFGKPRYAFSPIVHLDLSKTDDTQSGCSVASDYCLGNQSGQESSNTSARFEVVATEGHSKGAFVGDTNSTCSGSSTPRVDSHRSQSDEIAVAIAAARFAASRGSMDVGCAGNANGKRRDSELYIDCAKLRWRMWIQEASHEEAQEQAAEEELAPHAASFAAHLLWEHDRAVLEAERSNASAREAKIQAERAEEVLSRVEHESVSANISLKQSVELDESTKRFQYLVSPEHWCATELIGATASSENVMTELQASQHDTDMDHRYLAAMADDLHRSAQANARLENLEEEMSAESEIARELRNELDESKHMIVVDDRSADLAQELQRMVGLYEKQQVEMQEMLARSMDMSSSQCNEERCSQLDSKTLSEASSQTESVPTSDDRAKDLAQEVDSLQGLVQQLAEELGRMHNFHAEITVEKDAILKERIALRGELEEAEVLNATLEIEAERLRSPRDQEVAVRARDVLPSYPAPLRNGRATVPQASRARSQLLAEALARENRRLRTTTRAVVG